MHLTELVIRGLKGMPQELVVIFMAAMPISELRGSIPLALSLGMSFSQAFWLSIIGNTVFIAPALFLFAPISERLRRFRAWSRFFDWVFAHTKKNADLIQKYEAWGLAMFVAVPLPLTGAWSGVIAASLFKIRFRYAYAAIVGGVLCAGLIVILLCGLGIFSWKAVAH